MNHHGAIQTDTGAGSSRGLLTDQTADPDSATTEIQKTAGMRATTAEGAMTAVEIKEQAGAPLQEIIHSDPGPHHSGGHLLVQLLHRAISETQTPGPAQQLLCPSSRQHKTAMPLNCWKSFLGSRLPCRYVCSSYATAALWCI